MINYKLIILSLIIAFLFVSCGSLRDENKLKHAVLNKEDIPHFVILFFQTETKGQVGYASAYELRRHILYYKGYEHLNLDSLLSKALRGKYFFDCLSLTGCFELSNPIMDSYKKQSFKSFLKEFTQYDDVRNTYTIQYDLSDEERLTVAYYLYQNGYYTIFDDPGNSFFARKGIRKPIIEEIEITIIED